jgi:DNA-binding MarR family transcriptional regulator
MAEARRTRRPLALSQSGGDELRTWLALVSVFNQIEQRLGRVLDAAGLTLPQFDVLANLGMTEGITQQELAAKLLVTKGNVVGLLDRMETADLVERRPDPRDRRANRVYLTRRGRAALHEAFPAHLGVLQDVMSRFSASDHQALLRLLDKTRCAGD